MEKEELVIIRMKSPPMYLWDRVSNELWNLMSDEEQDKLVESAKVLLKYHIF